MKECITHHYACDCREGNFKALLGIAKEMRQRLEQHRHHWEVQEEFEDEMNKYDKVIVQAEGNP